MMISNNLYVLNHQYDVYAIVNDKVLPFMKNCGNCKKTRYGRKS